MKIWNGKEWREESDEIIQKNNIRNKLDSSIPLTNQEQHIYNNSQYSIDDYYKKFEPETISSRIKKIGLTKQSDALKDGYTFKNIIKTIGSTALDLGTTGVKSIMGIGESIGDLGQYGVAQVADWLGADKFANNLRENAKYRAVDAIFKPSEDLYQKNSIAGNTTRNVASGVGYVAGLAYGGGMLPKGIQNINVGKFSMPTTSIISGMGNAIGEAYENGATDGQAWGYGTLSGLAEGFSESLFGGLGKTLGKGALDDVIVGNITKNIKTPIAKILAQSGLKAVGEGVEEVVSGLGDAVAKKLTYMSKEDLGKLIKDENLLEQAILGTLTSMVVQAPSTYQSVRTKTDYITGDSLVDNVKIDQKNSEIKQENNSQTNVNENQTVNEENKKPILPITNNPSIDSNISTNQNINPLENLQEYNQQKETKKQNQQQKELSNKVEELQEKVDNLQNDNKLYNSNKMEIKNNYNKNIDYKSYQSVDFDKDYKKYESGNYNSNNDLKLLDNTPDYFYNLGYDTNKPLVINMTKLNSIMKEKMNNKNSFNQHGITKEIVEQLPYAISNPLNIIKNPKFNNRFVAITELSDSYGDIIIVPMEIDTYGKVNRVVSIYGKEQYDGNDNPIIKGYMEQNKDNIVYDIDRDIQKKSYSLDAPIALRNNSSANSISKNINNVNDIPLNNMKQNINNDTLKPNKQNLPKNPTLESSYDNDEKIEKKTRKQVREQLREEMGITDADLQVGNDIKAINFQITDPVRVNEKVFGKEIGDKINDATINRTKHNTAEKTRWLNQERSEIKELGIKPRSKESAAVQKYGEKQYVNEYGQIVPYNDVTLASEFPNIETQNKIKYAAEFLRNKYDAYIDQINSILTEMGYNEIPKRKDYMRHFQELSDVFSQTGVPFNLNDMKAEDLPTDINGLTEFNKPGKNWFASTQQRFGNKTNYDAITGIDGYLEGAGNLIYHTEDIQRYRALAEMIRNTYGQTKGFENLENLSDEQVQQRIKDIQENKLSKYVAWLDEQANSLAGKKGAIDRGVERAIGRKGYTFMNTVKKQVGSNMTGFNVRSALTNFISSIIAAAKTNKIALVKGTISTINNMFHNDGFIYKSDFLTNKFGSDQLSKKLWQKVSNAGQIFMTGSDYLTSNLITRSKYYEGLQKGLNEEQAIKYADDFSSRVMGDRSQGSTAEVFNSKTLGLLTQFQLEVNNQWQYMIHDSKMDYQEMSKNGNSINAGASVVFQLGQLAVFSYLFNELFEKITGSRSAFDPLEILKKIFGLDDKDDKKELSDRINEAKDLLIDNLPFASILTGGRIPISEALPIKELINGKDDNGNDKSRIETLKETIPYYLLPTGYSQIKKTTKGLSMYDESLPIAGSYTKSGKLRFTADESTSGKIKAALFGQWASKEAQEYIDSGYKSISESQIQEMKDLDMNSTEYREYRSGLNNSGTKQEDKIKYIANLKTSDENKNIMANNIIGTDKFKFDIEEYRKYDSLDEYKYAYNNPEKYKILKENNVSYDDYISNENIKEQYDWAYKNIDKYRVITNITSYVKYNEYKSQLQTIRNNTTNDKVETINYINSLPLSIPQKAMFIKMYYPSYNSYNQQIVEYINSQKMTIEEKSSLLKELGFKIENGRVSW